MEKKGKAANDSRTDFVMKIASLKGSRLLYLAFCMPFILAFLSWKFFPVFATWLVSTVFNYEIIGQADWLWYAAVMFFYMWYTFLTIGVAGVWAIAAAFVKLRNVREARRDYPMVSFIVPAYKEEKNVSRCITSLFKCAEKYDGLCEIIVVDDGSSDFTYEVAWAAIELNRRDLPKVRGKVVRHSVNLGKVEAIRTGVNSALGGVLAIVDADSWWIPNTLVKLVDYMLSHNIKAVTGYVSPSDGDSDLNPYVVLQQLEYSQGLGMNRCAQSLGNNVLIISGAIGLYDASILRSILYDRTIRSTTEDLEITLEMHKRGAEVGYASVAASSTLVPDSFRKLWNQRLRWFGGWFHNTLRIHRDMLLKRSWQSTLIWYSYIFEYGAALIDLAGLVAFPFLFWFAPDRVFFVASLLVFVPYGLLIGVLNQSLALKYAYNKHNYHSLLLYTPFYPILRLVNLFARLTSSIRYVAGDHGRWSA